MDYQNYIEPVAKKFSQLLQDELSTETVIEINHRNRQYNDASICASHDFCDANMVMLDAMSEVLGEDKENKFMHDSDLIALWNNAWTTAKQNKFFI